MKTDNLINTLNQYIESLKDENMKIIEDQSIALDKKNALMKKLLDKKKLAEFTIDSFQRIETTDYQPMCGMTTYRENDS
jgi:Ni,Fe-hydrogenase I large subunit